MEERASPDVGGGHRSASVAGPFVLHAAEHDPRRGGLRPVCRGGVCGVPRPGDGPAWSAAWPLLPVALDRLLRRDRLRARDRLACERFPGPAQFRGAGRERGGPGSFDDLADATADRRRDASRRLHVRPAALVTAGLRKGQTVAIETTLEANAALRSIVRRNTGESCQAFLT